MSKKIHTVQSSDKEEFDKEINFFLELGCELLDGTYEIINSDFEEKRKFYTIFKKQSLIISRYEKNNFKSSYKP